MAKHVIGYVADEWSVDNARTDAIQQLRDRGDLPEGKPFEITIESIVGYDEYVKVTDTTTHVPNMIHVIVRVAD